MNWKRPLAPLEAFTASGLYRLSQCATRSAQVNPGLLPKTA